MRKALDPFGITPACFVSAALVAEQGPPVFNGVWVDFTGHTEDEVVPEFDEVAESNLFETGATFKYSTYGAQLHLVPGATLFSGYRIPFVANSPGDYLVRYKTASTLNENSKYLPIMVGYSEHVIDGFTSCYQGVIPRTSTNEVGAGRTSGNYDEGEASCTLFGGIGTTATTGTYEADTEYYMRIVAFQNGGFSVKVWKTTDSEPVEFQCDNLSTNTYDFLQGVSIIAASNAGTPDDVEIKWLVYATSGTASNPETFEGDVPASWEPSPE